MKKSLKPMVWLCLAAAAAQPAWAGLFSANFNDGNAPAGTSLFANSPDAGVVEASGGVGNTGCLKLTKAANSLQGSMIIGDLDGGQMVNGFTANFKMRIGGGSSTPADGCSFCFANDLPEATFGEEGAGTGLRVSFDIYNNGGEAPAFRIFWGGTQVYTSGVVPIADLTTGANFVDVLIRINPTGSLDLVYNGRTILDKGNIGFQPIAAGRFGFGGRTGGLNANQFVDDVNITTTVGDFLQPGVARAPFSQRVIAGYPALLNVVPFDPAGLTYQWQKKAPGAAAFSNITGAKSATYITGPLALADAGTSYRVVLTNGGGVAVTSDPAVVDVVNLPHATPNTVAYDFNSGNTPAGTNVYGNAEPQTIGGAGNSGYMRLTEATGGQAGTWIVGDRNSGLPVGSIDIAFKMSMTPNDGEVPADGFGFHWAPDLPLSGFPVAEEPVGNGLSVGFDVYNNGGGEAPAVDVFWRGTRLGGTNVPGELLNTGGQFVDVQIRLSAFGLVDVSFNGVVLVYQLQIPGWTAFSGANYGFAARTGGAFQVHAIDDVQIKSVAYAGPIGFISQPQNRVGLPGNTATFAVTTNDPTRTIYQWQRAVGAGAFTNISSGAALETYTTPVLAVSDDGTRYRCKVTSTANGSSAESTPAILTIVNLTAPTAPQIFDRFNNLSNVDNQGSAPATVQTLSGDYTLLGVPGNGYIVLNPQENSKFGTLVIDDFNSGAAVGGFSASVKAQITGPDPADGWSFSWGRNISPVQVYGGLEAGVGSDLRVSFITYAGTGRLLRVNWRGTQIANIAVPLGLLQTAVDTFEEVLIKVTPATASASAFLDVAQDGQLVVQGLALPGLQGIPAARFALAARTGGLNELHAFDDLAIKTVPYVGPITLLSQPPASVLIMENTAITLTVESSNPPVTKYQWQRSAPGTLIFTDIPNATTAVLTTPILPATESGVRYQCVCTGATNAVTSDPSRITVVAPAIPTSWERIIDFNDGNVPGDATLFGSGAVLPDGGFESTGMLQLTTPANGLQGSLALADQDGGAAVTGFTTSFLLRMGNGTNPPADGVSFVWTRQPINGAFGEGGIGTGLILSFDIYDNTDGNPDNAAGEAPAIEAIWSGESLGNIRVPRDLLESGSDFRDVLVRVNSDGTLDVIFSNQIIFWRKPLPGFAPVTGGNFGWGGRTGGLNAEQDIDNIRLTTQTGGPSVLVGQVGTNIVITFDGILELSANGLGWTPMPNQTSPLILPVAGLSGPRFYRARK